MSDRPNITVRFFHKHDRDLTTLGKCGPKVRLKILKKRTFTHQKSLADLNNPTIDLDDDDFGPSNIEEIQKLPCGCDFKQLKQVAETVNKSAGRTAFLDVKRTSEEHLNELIDNNQLVVATVDDTSHPKNGQLIGCILTLPHSEDKTDFTVQYSGMFSVREDFQGQGIARKLSEFVVRDAMANKKKALQFTVWAPDDGLPHAQSERLISMYTRAGAVKVSEKNLLECYPHYEGLLKRPCKVVCFQMELNKTEMYLKAIKSSFGNLFKAKKSDKTAGKADKKQEEVENVPKSDDEEILVDKLNI